MPSISGDVKKRIAGALLIALGVLALTTPLVAGRWSLAILGLPLIAMGIAEAYVAFTSPRGTEASAYLPSALAFLAGNVLLLSSALVRHGLLDPADCNSDGRWIWKNHCRMAQVASGPPPIGVQRTRRFRMRGSDLVSQSFHRRRSGHWHHRRRLHCGRGLAVADGAGRGGRARYGRQSLERSPGPRARRSREREFCPFAFRDRQRVAVRARRRSIVDVDARDRVPGDPCRPDAADR